MSTSLHSFDSIWHPRLLAGLLRSSRLTLLYGAAGSGRTELLKAGLLPLLRRRASDLAAALGSDMAAPPRAPDRRADGSGLARQAEFAIVVDAWGQTPPLAQLKAQLCLCVPATAATVIARAPSLAEALTAASRLLGARFLFVFDRFEDLLTAPPERVGIDAFAEEMIGAINDPALPANFLLSVRDDAEPLLDRFSGRIAGFGNHYLRLPQGREALAEVASVAEPEDAVRLRPADVYVDIEARLARLGGTAAAPWQPPSPMATATPAEPPRFIDSLACAAEAAPTSAAPLPPTHTSARVRQWQWQPLARRAGWVAALAVLPLAWLAWPPIPMRAQATPAAPAPAIAAAPDADLAAPAAALAPVGFADELSALIGTAPLSVLRYDTLQALRAKPTAKPLQIVAPLALEEIVFVVRASATLRYLHEIGDRPLDAGDAGSVRVMTATAIHQRLFGAPARLVTDPTTTEAEALQRLAEGPNRSDVVAVVGLPALEAYAARHPSAMAQLKLLELDPQQPASRAALRAYLPSLVRAADHLAWLAHDLRTLAVMSFLVAPASIEQSDPASIAQVAQRLCERLPGLQQSGHPKWREVVPALQLPVGWPYSPTAAQTFASSCPSPSSTPLKGTSR